MLPGKRYTAEDILRIFQRRYWLLLVPFAVVSAVTAVVARRLPNVFVAQSTIVVVPPQVPESFVRTTVNVRLEGRLNAIAQQVLSRTRLEKIIDDLNLYPVQRRSGLMEDVVATMRRSIDTKVVKGDAFTVSFQGDDPKTVQKVTQRVASLFIEQNLRDRAGLAEGTNQFLEVQLEDARRQLQDQEKKLQAYRERNAGQLPSQLQANLQSLAGVQMQLSSTLESRNRDRDQRLQLQQSLKDAEADVAAAADAAPSDSAPRTPATADPAAAIGSPAQQLAAAKEALKVLELKYQPDFPSVTRMKRLIEALQQKVDADELTRPVSTATTGTPPVSAAEVARQRKVSDLQAQIDQIDKRIAANQAEEQRLRALAAEYQQKIDGVPERESEMTELTRDYGVLQSTYANLLQKKEEANISANVEKQQIGEQFNIVDEAQVPERPISPNRPAITFGGMAAGLGIGLALIVLLEYRATGFQTDDDVTRLLALPVLAVVPFMESEKEHRNATRWRWIADVGCGATVVSCLAVLAYTFVR